MVYKSSSKRALKKGQGILPWPFFVSAERGPGPWSVVRGARFGVRVPAFTDPRTAGKRGYRDSSSSSARRSCAVRPVAVAHVRCDFASGQSPNETAREARVRHFEHGCVRSRRRQDQIQSQRAAARPVRRTRPCAARSRNSSSARAPSRRPPTRAAFGSICVREPPLAVRFREIESTG